MELVFDLDREAAEPEVARLDLSMLGREDLVNLVLQRSEVLFDLPKSGQVIRAWGEGDSAPMEAQIDRLGETIARRAAGVIHAEYKALKPVLDGLNPRRIADIGCGYAFFDLFAGRDFKASLVLIDLEENGLRHFGFKAEGAAYSNLAVAKALLRANGIAARRITTLNPRDRAPESLRQVDLALSLLSCGFHYPVDPYLPFLEKSVISGGAAIFDLREARAEDEARKLARFGNLTDLPSPPKARRVLLRKEAA